MEMFSLVNYLRRIIHSFEKYSIYYDQCTALLAIGIVIALILEMTSSMDEFELSMTRSFDLFVWTIFVVDYAVRLIISKDRIAFVRHNIIDLIAILPFNMMFQGLRAVRLMRLIYMFRSFAYLNRAYKRIGRVLKTNDFDHVLWFTFCVIFLGAISISYIDDMEIGDALWWSFVTTTTVGYGDIAPTSVGGRIIAVCLMLIGIGFLSTLTSTIATFFIKDAEKSTYENEEITRIVNKLSDFNNLSVEDINTMHAILIALKKQDIENNKLKSKDLIKKATSQECEPNTIN
jgi:voltage-gated potassium channel